MLFRSYAIAIPPLRTRDYFGSSRVKQDPAWEGVAERAFSRRPGIHAMALRPTRNLAFPRVVLQWECRAGWSVQRGNQSHPMGANLASTGIRDCGMHAEHH